MPKTKKPSTQAQKQKTQKQEAPVVLSGRGHKKPISASSFNKSTHNGVIRKGFISSEDLKKTSVPQFTLDEIKKHLKKESLIFVRDKQVLFILTGKNCVFSEDTNLSQYIEYFRGKNPELNYTGDKWTPSDLKKRGSKAIKEIASKGYSL